MGAYPWRCVAAALVLSCGMWLHAHLPTVRVLPPDRPLFLSPTTTPNPQTLNVTPSLCLCDCPGLVLPQYAQSKAEMVAAGERETQKVSPNAASGLSTRLPCLAVVCGRDRVGIPTPGSPALSCTTLCFLLPSAALTLCVLLPSAALPCAALQPAAPFRLP